MNRNSAIAVCTIALLLFSSLSFAVSLSSFTGASSEDSSTEVIEAFKRHIDRRPYHPSSVDRTVEVVVPVRNGTTALKSSPEFTINRVYTEDGRHFVRGTVPLSNVRSLLDDTRLDTVRITSTRSVSNARHTRGVERINADVLHERGIRGENITVGVIDSGFWISHPSIANRVGAYRQFGTGSTPQHGTTVASVIVDTAPGSTLHLASIGSATTPDEYAAAVKWLEQSGADIIVDAGSYYAQPGDGTGEIARIATNISDETVFTTSVGNHARRYWAGNHTSGEWVIFHNGTQANPLNNGDSLRGKVRLTLRWDELSRSNTAPQYDLYLFRVQPGDDAVVARTDGNDTRQVRHLETSVPKGRYYVSIRNSDHDTEESTTTADTELNETQSTLELFSNRDLRYRSLGGPAPPANAPGVISVGASGADAVASFSARGADIVAPDSAALDDITIEGGTSVSTPYVAGTAALLLSLNPYLTAKEVRRLLVLSADDIGADGIDTRSGFGLVNATRAAALMNRTSGESPTATALGEPQQHPPPGTRRNDRQPLIRHAVSSAPIAERVRLEVGLARV